MKAVYAGSFDPPTTGHLDIIQRASRVFDELIVGIGTNSSKTPLFNAGERSILVTDACTGLSNVTVVIFRGLLVDYCKKVEAPIIVRGLRAVSDFEAELAQAHTNHKLHPEVDTFFLVTQPENSFVSSSMVREVAKLGGDISPFVPLNVVAALKRKLSGGKPL
jgi:pantetheine-phosphate adenylyltransferase